MLGLNTWVWVGVTVVVGAFIMWLLSWGLLGWTIMGFLEGTAEGLDTSIVEHITPPFITPTATPEA